MVLGGCGANGYRAEQTQVLAPPPKKKAKQTQVSIPPPNKKAGRFSSLEVSMTEQELEEFQRQRDQFRTLPWFKHTTPTTHMTQEQLRAARRGSRNSLHRGLYVELPTRLVSFTNKHIDLDLHDDSIKPHLGRLPEAFPYFPELRTLIIENYERDPGLTPLLRGTYRLANLSSIALLDGALSSEEVSILAEHPTLRVLYLSRCRISLEDFSQLAKLETLEMVYLSTGPAAMPECFLTLAKLPRFRAVCLDGDDAFNVPVSDDVRGAIESLDGRLEEVVTEWTLKVHPSIVRALVKVKSLRVLEIGSVAAGLRLADIEPLEDLEDLRHFSLTLDPNDRLLDPTEHKKMGTLIGRTSRQALERSKQMPRKTGLLR